MADASTTHRDPVCGMSVNPARAAGSSEHRGHTYYFCGTGCVAKFTADPDRYVQPLVMPSLVVAAPLPPKQNAEPVEYTCPMHPEVRQIGPGVCPKCGMALEPVMISAHEEENPELKDMTRRFWVSVALTIPVLLIAMADFIPGRPLEQLGSARVWTWFELIVATPVVLWGGWPFFVRGWQSLVNRSLNMFTLIALGVGVAYSYSVVAALFPAGFRDERGDVAVYFEPAAVIVTLILLG